MDKYNQEQTRNSKGQESIRTFIFSDLPEKEKEKFMEFMINNNVEFVRDKERNYIATI